MTTIIDLTTQAFELDRSLLRKQVINIFLNEHPGTGRNELTQRYQYIVLRKNGCEVYLARPAQFNNGFDFTLNVSGINFNPTGRRTTRPTHQNIYDDLALKKGANINLYEDLKVQIDRIYACLQPTTTVFEFGVGLDSEILLACIKWLLIEQDVTYWNYSGRAMFYSGIDQV